VRKGAIFIFMKFFKKKPGNMQPEYARLANRAVKIAKLSEIYNIPLADGGASELAGLIAEIPDKDLDNIGITTPIIGCPAKIIPLFAGYSCECAVCPYFARDGTEKNECVINEKGAKP